ncbi:MAG: CARDB domain-containing protein [Lacipirellulaceae bacterium]
MSIRPATRRHTYTTLVGLLLAVVATLAPIGAGGQEPGRNGTLADRLLGLRRGWDEDLKQTPPAATQSPRPLAAASRNGLDRARPLASAPARQVTVEARPVSAVPKVDPRALVPRNWFGVEPDSIASDADARTPAPKDQASGVRGRLQRDLQGQAAGPALGSSRTEAFATDQDFSQRATPRAGSALSAVSSAPGGQATAGGSAGPSAALRRSIAADVARSMGEQPTPPTLTPAATAPPEAATDVVEVEPIKVAPTGSQAKLNSASSGPTKLPLVIGNEPKPAARATTIESSLPTKGHASNAAATSVAASTDNVLMSQRTAMVVSRVEGPRTIVVGREATYRVEVANRGDASAEKLVTRVSVPTWAEVVASAPSAGAVERLAAEDGASEVVWQMNELVPGGAASLDLKLIARAGKPIDLAVSCKHRMNGGKATVEVQEPKLSLELSGPEEVLFGKPQAFRLTISNPGTGPAEGVSLRLTPPGKDATRGVTHSLGSLAAGESRSVEVELTAREAGKLDVNASVTATGDLSAATTKQIFCRRAELAVDWRGPQQRYAGAPAVYYFRVRNPGTAVAPDVELSIQLPEGFRIDPLADTPEAAGGRLLYRVGSMRPGDDRYFEVRGALAQAGPNRIAFSAAASDETRSTDAVAVTEVVAVADLKLEVVDPSGPMAVGSDVTYQVRVVNRGASVAREVKVIGLFSEGIEPVSADGDAPSIKDGRVAFATIDELPISGEKVYTIHAKAKLAGAHLFRAEVLCRDLEIKLAAEETTRFFADEAIEMADGSSSASY